MARRTQQFAVDGELYEVTQLGTTAGLPLGHRLMKAVGPALRRFLDALPKGATDVEEPRLLSIVIEALEGAPTELLMDLGMAFAAQTKVRSSTLMLDLVPLYEEHFAGRFPHWVKWVLACARFNFAGFFPSSVAGAATSAAPAAAATPSPSA